MCVCVCVMYYTIMLYECLVGLKFCHCVQVIKAMSFYMFNIYLHCRFCASVPVWTKRPTTPMIPEVPSFGSCRVIARKSPLFLFLSLLIPLPVFVIFATSFTRTENLSVERKKKKYITQYIF